MAVVDGGGGDEGGDGENIWVAASDGDLDRVRQLLARGVAVNARDELGYNPLQAAVSYGHLELARYLLAHGADPQIRDGDDDTPLHVCETVECAELLLAAGAALDSVNSEGFLPHETAYNDDRMEVEAYLRQRMGLPPSEPKPDESETLQRFLDALERGEVVLGDDDDDDGQWNDMDDDGEEEEDEAEDARGPTPGDGSRTM